MTPSVGWPPLRRSPMPMAEKAPATSGWARAQRSFIFMISRVASALVPGGVSMRTKMRPVSAGGKNSLPSWEPKPAAATRERNAMPRVAPRWESAQKSTAL